MSSNCVTFLLHGAYKLSSCVT